MGSKRKWLIVLCIMSGAWLWPLVQGSEIYTRDSLDSFLYNYAFKKIHSPRAGKLYDNIPLPANLSGVKMSMVRLRTSRLWKNGANFSSFSIPPLILPRPFTKRVDIVYQDLGNLSSSYYNVPNHTFVAPVIGFLAYDPNRSSINYGLIELKLMGNNPITVLFPNIKEDGNVTMKCVRFNTNGTLEFSNMTVKSSCVVRKQGHFSVVIPYQPEKDKAIKWWVIVGIVVGVLVLVLIVVVCIVGYKWIKRKRIKKMERMSERSVGLDTIWIGRSRMPSAAGIRTQPVLENSFVP
ncbi:hypothetical protein DH2020_023093 [Rehmannia glutinosa]|uniref:Uncharacterized protein n=1 Tax=Rehmannia glutinosa TaxID=99300 RepID=A0ABR0W6H7_REHGL